MRKTTTTLDMTQGNIIAQIILFAMPLMLGNIFQMLYNTVDSIVVGNFVGTEALAAVGATTMIINMLVFFFNGFSVGAGVVIGTYFGAKDMEKLHIATETTIASTFVLSLIFTVIGVLGVTPMLNFMSTPEDVMSEATLYLRVYFAGISGLLIYNIGSGILRAVGDTRRPLYFLILTSILNIILDLVFVIVFKLGIVGVALATIISQFISAFLTLRLLTKTNDIYKLTWNDLQIDRATLGKIMLVGLPAGVQSVITAFSNVFVQAYINFFGSSCMAGWSCYNKIDQFIMLPMQSMAMASTTFVSQNMGAEKVKRANDGTKIAVGMILLITGIIATVIWIFAAHSVRLFTSDQSVISYGILFLRTNVYFLMFNCINHVLAGALRGRGDSKGPMIIMLVTFVVVRQIYLFIITRFIANTPALVAFGYPVGWMSCCLIEVSYFFIKFNKIKNHLYNGGK
ncbi:MATE family efflux transporter [Oribacterium sp. WCC10]|uniref:MATE family efflux transporter n=1 Tax=Oribacterium sp. WCC10 TaxID=1855343 RepID=UPI0008E93CFC|nr:MATE family efflux transporter [Oribacterium sp. WCC10]SFG71781.1 putative efflux protein, MATE family [Oribacterium sp. WCC10]